MFIGWIKTGWRDDDWLHPPGVYHQYTAECWLKLYEWVEANRKKSKWFRVNMLKGGTLWVGQDNMPPTTKTPLPKKL